MVDAIQKAGVDHIDGQPAAGGGCSVVCRCRLPLQGGTRVDLAALVRDGDQLQNPLLFDGDTIKLEARLPEDASNSASWAVTTLAPTQITVNVIWRSGNHPGTAGRFLQARP